MEMGDVARWFLVPPKIADLPCQACSPKVLYVPYLLVRVKNYQI